MGVITGYNSWDLELYRSVVMQAPDVNRVRKPVSISEVVGYPVGFT